MKPFDPLTRRTKIVCTLGPNTNTYECMKKLAETGMNVARLNFSHGTYEVYERMITDLRKISAELDYPISILQDLQGPKIRVKTFKDGKVELVSGKNFVLTTREVEGTAEIVSVSYPSFHKDVKVGNPVLLDDGNLQLTVKEVKGQDVTCVVEKGGILKDKKGLNLPENILSIESLSPKDLADLDFGIEHDVDYIALSFVQKPEDIQEIKAIIAQKGKNIPVVAKIEKPQAVDNLDAITNFCDAVMVARGDLGVEMFVEEVPSVQKRIIELCNRKGLPVITATQMLESMIENPRPTRAEATDVANAVLDGTDAVMLSAETATGKYPYDAVATMDRIIRNIESHQKATWKPRRQSDTVFTTAESICYAAANAAEKVDAKAIVCLTERGNTPVRLAHFRPTKPIISVTHNPTTHARLSLVWGVGSLLSQTVYRETHGAMLDVFERLKAKKLAQKGDLVIIIAGVPFYSGKPNNMMFIESVL